MSTTVNILRACVKMFSSRWIGAFLFVFLITVLIFYCILLILNHCSVTTPCSDAYIFAVSLSLAIIAVVATTITGVCLHYRDSDDAQGCFLFACSIVAVTLLFSAV